MINLEREYRIAELFLKKKAENEDQEEKILLDAINDVHWEPSHIGSYLDKGEEFICQILYRAPQGIIDLSEENITERMVDAAEEGLDDRREGYTDDYYNDYKEFIQNLRKPFIREKISPTTKRLLGEASMINLEREYRIAELLRTAENPFALKQFTTQDQNLMTSSAKVFDDFNTHDITVTGVDERTKKPFELKLNLGEGTWSHNFADTEKEKPYKVM